MCCYCGMLVIIRAHIEDIMKILVTGANGYIGTHLVEYFTGQSKQVLSASRNGESDVFMDFSSPKQVASLKIKGIDMVIHTVFPKEQFIKQEPLKALAEGILSIRAILDFCVNNQIKRFLYFSSFHVLGRQTGEINELTDPMPVTDYGYLHYMAEQMVEYYSKAKGILGTCVRLSNVYGLPASSGSVTRWNLTPFSFCREAVLNRKIVLQSSGMQKRNFVHINNVLNCTQFALENPQYPLLHCYGEETYSIYEFAQCVCQHIGSDVVIERPENVEDSEDRFLHFYSLFFKPCETSLLDYIDQMCNYIKRMEFSN